MACSVRCVPFGVVGRQENIDPPWLASVVVLRWIRMDTAHTSGVRTDGVNRNGWRLLRDAAFAHRGDQVERGIRNASSDGRYSGAMTGRTPCVHPRFGSEWLRNILRCGQRSMHMCIHMLATTAIDAIDTGQCKPLPPRCIG